jgi:hypothetical protein
MQSDAPNTCEAVAYSATQRRHFDAAASIKIERFLSYWQKLSKAIGGVPLHRDFDPIAVPELLPNLLMIEARAAGGPSRIRLAGSRIAAAMGIDVTGYDLQALPRAEDARVLAEAVCLCLKQQRPIPGESLAASANAKLNTKDARAISSTRFLALPLSVDGRTPSMALVLMLFSIIDGREFNAEWLGMRTTI